MLNKAIFVVIIAASQFVPDYFVMDVAILMYSYYSDDREWI